MATGGRSDQGLDSLTRKQRDVLDLLIQHKTSKQISRDLDISPFTVDQRLNAARDKLGLATRIELAQRYRALVGGRGEPTVVVDPTPAGSGSDHAPQSQVGPARISPVVFPSPPVATESAPFVRTAEISSQATPIEQETVVFRPAPISQSTVYQPFGIAPGGVAGHFRPREGGARAPADGGPRDGLDTPGATYPGEPAADYHHVLPEMFDGPYGTVLRLGAMLLTTLTLMVLALAGMAIYSQLGVLLDR